MSMIASAVLPELGSDVVVNYYRQGRHHRVYTIRFTKLPRLEYLFRVCLPFDAYLKIASEVATITYLCQETTIPVTVVVAYIPGADNTLGFA